LQVKTAMREYHRGALQSLAWARMLLSNVKDMTDLEKALAQIDKAMETLRGPKPQAALDEMKRQTTTK
jgi:hypothetical protein